MKLSHSFAGTVRSDSEGERFDPKDYVPLTERKGWKRKVIVLPPWERKPQPPHNPTFGQRLNFTGRKGVG